MTKKRDEQRRAVVSSLTTKQAAFLYEYLRNAFNATAAAKFAKYKNPNNAGPRLLTNPKIIRALEFEVIAPGVMDAEEVLGRLSEQARGEYSKYFITEKIGYVIGEKIGYRDVLTIDFQKMIDDGKGHLIKGVKQTQYGQVIEFHDAHLALVDMGRAHKLFIDRLDQNTATNNDGRTLEEWQAGDEDRRKRASDTAVMFEDEGDDVDP